MDEEAIRHLQLLKCRVLAGEISDWPDKDHEVSMTCAVIPNEHWLQKWRISWKSQLMELLARLKVILE